MSDSIYSFRASPTYRAATSGEMFEAAMDMPMSRTSTFFDQGKGGILESFGLGTAIRDITTPEGDQEIGMWDFVGQHPAITAYKQTKRLAQWIVNDPDSPALSEDAYKTSPYFRDGVPWDAAMTEDRAASLAEAFDAKKVREFYASKRPITAFIGNLGGQALDPINYIPVAGPAVKAGMVARLGKVAGASVTASLDAAANTAIAALATAPTRRRIGDDVSWQTTVSQIATAALIGSAFGAIGGALDRSPAPSTRSAIEARLSTLKATQEARIALNEAIDGVVRGEDLNLSPNVTEPVARIAGDVGAQVRGASLPPPDESVYLSARELRQAYNAQYEVDGVQIASSRSVPSTAEIPPVGSWRIDDVRGVYGRDIERLEEVPIEGLVLPELRDGQLDAAKLGDDATYAGWIKDGKEPPPIELIRMEDGRLRVSDGHRRVLAAQANGATSIKGWVSELADTGKVDAEGRPMKTSQTFELAQQGNSDKLRQTPTAPAIDTSPARVDPPPSGLPEAEKAIARPDDYKAMASQYRVDPETGTFGEEAEIQQLAAEGRLTEEDAAALDDAQKTYDDGAAYGEALKSVANCLI